MYFGGDPANATDPVLSLVPPARRTTLIAAADGARPRCWRFAIRLQGPGETVFFDR
jgi:protocatechuate 3,4-dioxygenase alpha subunit